MFRLISAFVLVAAIAACGTTEKYEAILNTFVGGPERRLVAEWGPPDSFYEAEGVRYLTYRKSSSTYFPGSPPTVTTEYVGRTAYTRTSGGSSGFFITRECTTTFTVAEGRVASWKHKGDDCRAQ